MTREPWWTAGPSNSPETHDEELSELTFALEAATWFGREVSNDCAS